MMRFDMRRLLMSSIMTALLGAVACADSPTAPVMTPEPSGTTTPPATTAPPSTTTTPPVTTTPITTVPAGAYNITVRYIGTSATPVQVQAVAAAVAKWQSVITGDLADITAQADANACFAGQPALNERVDDILIFVEFSDIDGVGKVLGEAGPCFIRNSGNLPLIGRLKLDQADLLRMEQTGTLDAVVLHEMGHVLGIGTLWPAVNLISGAGGTDPRFIGSGAVTAYHTLGGGDANVPVEDQGSAGTRDGHWRESVFGNELMTGYISGSTNPMSAMTIASLTDMGYNTNRSAAGSYSFATSTQRVTEPVDLHRGERVVRPKFVIDRDGRKGAIPANANGPWKLQ
ncbi:MAG: leishmanolysin-related zinc metalloendopeptidase [Longimicrobiales bacterium]